MFAVLPIRIGIDRSFTIILHVAEKRKPGRASRISFRSVVNAQDAANNILVDLDAESQRDLLSNARTAPAGIAPLRCNNSVNEVFFGPTGPGRCLRWGENNKQYFHFLSTLWRWMKASERWRNGERVPGA